MGKFSKKLIEGYQRSLMVAQSELKEMRDLLDDWQSCFRKDASGKWVLIERLNT